MKLYDETFMTRAFTLAYEGLKVGNGGPFGAVVVKAGKIIGEGNNCVTSTNDPSAHAEMVAIRNACKHLKDFQLNNCEIYSSCEPCPMCLGAIYWARPRRLYFALTREDAAKIGFDDEFIYEELKKNYKQRTIPTFKVELKNGIKVFEAWEKLENKIEY